MQLSELGQGDGRDFLEMTFPSYRHLLDFEPVDLYPHEGSAEFVRPIGIGARAAGLPAGLALGCLPEGPADRPRLLSLCVAPAWRRQGIGKRLLERFESLVAAEDFPNLRAVYMTGNPGTTIFEHLIAKRGWSHPEMRMLSVRFTLEEAMKTRWYSKYRPRKGFEIFPWKELTADEERELRRSQAETGWIAEDLVPWKYDRPNFDHVSSVGARLHGRVVGWVINHRTGGKVIRFTCSFMRRDLSRRARILPLYSESIRRLSEEPVRLCTLTVPKHHPEMVSFVKRWCSPWVGFTGETRDSIKQVTRNPAER